MRKTAAPLFMKDLLSLFFDRVILHLFEELIAIGAVIYVVGLAHTSF